MRTGDGGGGGHGSGGRSGATPRDGRRREPDPPSSLGTCPHTTGQQAHEKASDHTDPWRCAHQNLNEGRPHSCESGQHREEINAGDQGEKREHSCTLGRWQTGTTTIKATRSFLEI